MAVSKNRPRNRKAKGVSKIKEWNKSDHTYHTSTLIYLVHLKKVKNINLQHILYIHLYNTRLLTFIRTRTYKIHSTFYNTCTFTSSPSKCSHFLNICQYLWQYSHQSTHYFRSFQKFQRCHGSCCFDCCTKFFDDRC